jgi:hypothetical protein
VSVEAVEHVSSERVSRGELRVSEIVLWRVTHPQTLHQPA